MVTEILHQIRSNWSGTLTALLPWIPVLLVSTLVEQLCSVKKTNLFLVSANVVYMAVALTLSGLVVFPCITWMSSKVPHDLFDFGSFKIQPGKSIVVWVAYLLIFDFLYYWFHRAQHQVHFMWRYHMVHHSDTNISASSVGRHHWLEEGFRYFFITAPLIVLLGGGDGMPVWFAAIIGYNGILGHWNVPFRFGLLEKVWLTPAYHRIHHSIEEKHFDMNFGVYTQFWDFVFGTRYLPAKEEFPTTGISDLSDRNALALLLPWPIIFKTNSKSMPA